MAAPRVEKAYEKHAWILILITPITILLITGLGVIGLGIVDLLAQVTIGMTLDELDVTVPYVGSWIRDISRSFGVVGIGFGIFGIAIALKGYRRGEKWAWYVSWYQPLTWAGLGVSRYIFTLKAGITIVTAFPVLPPIFALLAVLGLLLPYRKFFPKRQVAPA